MFRFLSIISCSFIAGVSAGSNGGSVEPFFVSEISPSTHEGEYVYSGSAHGEWDAKYAEYYSGKRDSGEAFLTATIKNKEGETGHMILPSDSLMIHAAKVLSQRVRSKEGGEKTAVFPILRGGGIFMIDSDPSYTVPCTIQSIVSGGHVGEKDVRQVNKQEVFDLIASGVREFTAVDDVADTATTLAKWVKLVVETWEEAKLLLNLPENETISINFATVWTKMGRAEPTKIGGESYGLNLRGSMELRLSSRLATLCYDDFIADNPSVGENEHPTTTVLCNKQLKKYINNRYLRYVDSEVESVMSFEKLIDQGYMKLPEAEVAWISFASTTLNPDFMDKETFETLKTMREEDPSRIYLVPMLHSYEDGTTSLASAILSNGFEDLSTIDPAYKEYDTKSVQTPLLVIGKDGKAADIIPHVKKVIGNTKCTVLGVKTLTSDTVSTHFAEIAQDLKAGGFTDVQYAELPYSASGRLLPSLCAFKLCWETIKVYGWDFDKNEPIFKGYLKDLA